MAVASFENLCADFCEIVGVPTPALTEDLLGRVAFHVTLRGTTVNLVHLPRVCPDHIFVLFELGPLGTDSPETSLDLQYLLEANFSLLKLNPPVFSRNPDTGDVLLQYVYPFFDASGHDLRELIDDGIDLVVHWRDREQPAPVEPSGAALLQIA